MPTHYQEKPDYSRIPPLERHVQKKIKEVIDAAPEVKARAEKEGPARHEVEEDPVKAGVLYLLRVRLRELESCLETIRHRHGYGVDLEKKIEEVRQRIGKIAGQ